MEITFGWEWVLPGLFKTWELLLSHFSHAQLFVTPWTVAHQTPLSMEFSRQEYSSGLPFPSPVDLYDPRIEPISLISPELAGPLAPLSKATTWLFNLEGISKRSLSLLLKRYLLTYLAVLGLSWGMWVQLPHSMWDLISATRDGTCVSCIARQILNHWIAREVP